MQKFGTIDLPAAQVALVMRGIAPIKIELADVRRVLLLPAGAKPPAVGASSAPAAELSIPALSPAAALTAIRVRPDMQVEVGVAEPLVMDPVAIAWGADSRLWGAGVVGSGQCACAKYKSAYIGGRVWRV